MTERISDLEAEGRELTRQLSTLEARIKAYQVILEVAAAATELVCCLNVLLPGSELPKNCVFWGISVGSGEPEGFG